MAVSMLLGGRRAAAQAGGLLQQHRLAAFAAPGVRWPVRPAPAPAGGPRACSSAARPPPPSGEAAANSAKDSQQRWDITPQRWVDIKYTEADIARFPGERETFRKEARLRPEVVPLPPSADEAMDWLTALKGFVSCFRLGDLYTEMFQELVLDRLTDSVDLMELFAIPVVEDKPVVQPMHSKAVPGEGTYLRVRMQTYWLAVHVWLLHSKQHTVQDGEGLFVSALCALLTRRIFEFQWNRVRMLLHAADVPIMSVTNELQDLQEFVFGLCVALDDAFKEEAPKGCAKAIAAEDADLGPDRYGLAPQVKYILWANVYSGSVPHDAPQLHELTVYILRQRMLLDAMQRDCFLSCRFGWAEHPR